MSIELWTAVAAIAAAIQTIVVLVAAVLAIRQLREATRARSLDAFLAISEDLKKEEAVEARKIIYTQLANSEILSEEQKKKIESICVTFDKMGVLVKHGLIPKDVAFSMYFDVVLRIWKHVEPFVIQERERRKNDIWMMYFETLKKECWAHWIKLLKSHPEWNYLKKDDDIYYYF